MGRQEEDAEPCEARSGNAKTLTYLALQLDLLFVRVRRIPFGESGLTLAVLDEDE